MQRALQARLQGAGAALSAFSPAQRILAVLGVALLVLGGTAFTRWATAPTYALLFSNLAGEDASAIVEQLNSSGVPYELTDGGHTIMVPREEVNDQRLKASAAGLPSASETGYSLLDEQGVTASQFQQQITYQRALEGELASTVKSVEGVRTAVVHLAIPEESVFLDETAKPTASVLVATAAGRSLSPDQVQAIVHLVASSVDGMEPEQVTVVDADGSLLSAAGQGAGAAGGVREQETAEYEQRTVAAIQAMLDRVLGPGKAVATVTADLNYDQTQRTSETFTAEEGVPPLSESTTTERYRGGAGAGVGGALGDNGVLGMDLTELGVEGGEGAGNGYDKESTTRNNAVNKVTEQTVAAPGTVRRQSVAVVVDGEAAAGTGIAQLTDMVTAAAGVDVARGDVLSVTQAPFDTSAADAAAESLAAAEAAEAAERTQRLIVMGAAGLVLLVLLLVVVLVARRAAKKRRREVIDLGQLDVLYDETQQDALPGPRTPLLDPPEPDVAALRREEFAELVDQQPAEVADLLRGWLAEKK